MSSTKTTSSTTASHPILDELEPSLYHALTILSEKWQEVSLTLTPIPPSTTKGAERTFQLETPNESIALIRLSVYPLGSGTYEVYVALADGPTRRLTYDPTRKDTTTDQNARLNRLITTTLLEEIDPRLGEKKSRQSEMASSAVPPQIDFDCDGTIQYLNSAARDLIGNARDPEAARSFFAHVHGNNLRRVVRDLTHMKHGKMQNARWLLRLYTGASRGRWYRVRAMNRLDSAGVIRSRLHPLNGTQETSADHDEHAPK